MKNSECGDECANSTQEFDEVSELLYFIFADFLRFWVHLILVVRLTGSKYRINRSSEAKRNSQFLITTQKLTNLIKA